MSCQPDFLLAIHPSSRGFGWVLFEGPLSPFDWGTVDARKNALALERLEVLLLRYAPRGVVLEAFADGHSQRRSRIQGLCRQMLPLAAAHGAAVHIVSRESVRSTFAASGALTREQIAAAVAKHLEPLRPRLPRPRRIWESEPTSLALFAAAAAGLAFYAQVQTTGHA